MYNFDANVCKRFVDMLRLNNLSGLITYKEDEKKKKKKITEV